MNIKSCNYARPAAIRDDHTNPQRSSTVFSSEYVSLWQRKEIANCLNSCSVNYLIALFTLCMLMDSLIIVYHHRYLRKSSSSVTFFVNWIFISILLLGTKVELMMILMISTQIFLTIITSSLLQHRYPFCWRCWNVHR